MFSAEKWGFTKKSDDVCVVIFFGTAIRRRCFSQLCVKGF